ncbi:hypothetical protein N0V88_003109 [Collariella sp. IMI 366227]|nr:hypothetical protein N0V88_003109 [Collariella sp. IMI 366227]
MNEECVVHHSGFEPCSYGDVAELSIAIPKPYQDLVTYNNRDFQQYALDNGIYFAPVDDVSIADFADLKTHLIIRADEQDEIERLQYQHAIFNMMFESRLIFPPISRPRRILECGSGSGAWAMEVAQQHPECEVIGIDVYPYPVPQDMPPNLDFQVDDLNSP